VELRRVPRVRVRRIGHAVMSEAALRGGGAVECGAEGGSGRSGVRRSEPVFGFHKVREIW
jgi:hypothetical protein